MLGDESYTRGVETGKSIGGKHSSGEITLPLPLKLLL